MTTGRVRIESLADHLDLVETVARWHWDAWGHEDPGASLASWTAGMRARANRDRIPMTYVALDGAELVGTASLIAHEMVTHPEWSPWLGGVYVRHDRRGEGIGSALVREAVRAAAAMNEPRLYLSTESARGFYEKLGWRAIAVEEHAGQPVTIMVIETKGDLQG
jgi:GNAT superfamily N-acetyltransferase